MTDIDFMEVIRARHSVRAYTDRTIEPEARRVLEAEIAACNAKGNLHMSLVCDEPQAFDSTLAHYGKFSGVRNYVVIAGEPAVSAISNGGAYSKVDLGIVKLHFKIGAGIDNFAWV